MRLFIFCLLILPCKFALPQKNSSKIVLFPESKYRLIGLAQERMIGKRISVQGTFRFMPETGIPEAKYAAGSYKNYDNNPLKDTKASAAGIVTELRMYTGRKKTVNRGFYWGPFLSLGIYHLKADNYTAVIRQDYYHVFRIPMKQSCTIKTFGAGLQIGVQKMIMQRFAIDWTILGIGICGTALNADIKAENLPEEIDLRTFPEYFSDTKYAFENYFPLTKTVAASSIHLSGKGILPMLRMSLGIGLAY